MSKAYIIDGNSLLFRAYYATAYGPNPNIMRTKEGIPTNAIFSFSNMLNKILGMLKTDDALFVAFDTGKETFRHKEDETYKANRKPCPPDLLVQMPIVRELLHALDIFVVEQEGYEADDLCGTYAKMAGKAGYEVIVFTSDRDFLQLIDENISIHILKTGMSNILVMNTETMPELYGFQPLQIIDYKGLRGDASDNIPGIPGIGEKTAVKLIQEYGSFENILANAANIKGKVGEAIANNMEIGRHSYHLAQIDINVPVNFTIDETIYQGYEFDKINEFCNKYELKQFLNRVPLKLKKESSKAIDIDWEEISTLDNIEVGDDIAICLDSEAGNYHYSEIYGMGLFINDKAFYIKAENFADKKLNDVLKDKNIKKYCYDYKAIKVALSHKNIEIEGLYFDSLLAAYILDSSLSNNLDQIMHYFGADISSKKDESMSLFDNSNPEKAVKVAYFSKKIANKALEDLAKVNSQQLYQQVEIPLATVLAEMEIEGFPLHRDVLEEMGEDFKKKLNISKDKIYEIVGEEFNIDSPKQVADILFNKLGLPDLKKGSTSVEVLKELKDKHPVIEEILTYRKYAKLLSTYVTGLISQIHDDGKIHAMFNQALTTTGRLSSSEPNLQNISVRDEEGKLIRKAFYFEDNNWSILSLDYSQIELRILASLSKCKKLQDVFASGEDIHAATAKHVFRAENPTANERRRAKAVNFGIIYGISDWGLSEQIECPVYEAKQIINDFYNAYPEIAMYFQNIANEVTENCYVTTLLGRRRYLREIKDANYQVREFARRAAMNAPIQGTAADLIKIAMIKVNNALKEKNLKSKLICQIHDELLLKVSEDEKDIVLPLVKEIMENALVLDTKLEVDGGYGRTWYDAK